MAAGRLPYIGAFEEVKEGHLSGKMPDPRTINKQVGVGLVRVLMKALAKNPEQRFSLAAFKKALAMLHPGPERAPALRHEAR